MRFHNNDTKLLFEILDPKVANDPLAFVMMMFPWGLQGTPLFSHRGPRKWQKKVLTDIKEHLWECEKRNVEKKPMEVFRKAIASGRGIGKSALVSWLIIWFLSTRIGGTCMVSANSEAQLKTVTWGELGKWLALSANKHWFELSATSIGPSKLFRNAIQDQLKIGTDYYYAQAKLWSEENPDAYAGVHNPLGVLLLFDEASGIPKPIWSVADGFFTEPVVNRFWFAFSNPRRNSGAFFECFHSDREYWLPENIDSRDVEGTDRGLYDKIIKQYGEDSDEARVEVKGQFPLQGDSQFISRDVIRQAQERELFTDDFAPLIMGVDVARFGSDSSVIRFRRGRDARSYPVKTYKGLDNMQLSYKVAELIDKYNPDAVCIDAGGGTGVIDRLKEMRYKVHEVWFGANSDDPEYKNKRTQMWGRMREWLNGGCIDNSRELADDLAGPEYRFYQSSDVKILESKESMKKRGLHSPDHGDALALCFSVNPARSDIQSFRRRGQNRVAQDVDYNLFA